MRLFIAREALASSGTVNIFAWAGYISDEMLAAFEKSTGIKPVYTPYGTNDELLNQMRASNGAGYDIIWPAVDRVPNYVEFGLVQPIDESKVQWDRALQSAVKGSETLGAVVNGKRYQVPTDWGTEALSFEKSASPLEYGKASYGDIWKPEMKGKAISDGPLPFVFGAKADQLKRRYWMRDVTPKEEVGKHIWLEAFPKFQQDAANFQSATIILNESDCLPFALRLVARKRFIQVLVAP